MLDPPSGISSLSNIQRRVTSTAVHNNLCSDMPSRVSVPLFNSTVPPRRRGLLPSAEWQIVQARSVISLVVASAVFDKSGRQSRVYIFCMPFIVLEFGQRYRTIACLVLQPRRCCPSTKKAAHHSVWYTTNAEREKPPFPAMLFGNDVVVLDFGVFPQCVRRAFSTSRSHSGHKSDRDDTLHAPSRRRRCGQP